jgi:CelD/BcsL family acetyltransferase involved in cellulose biosynthesis
VRVDVVQALDLTDAQVATWRALQALTPEFGTPLVSPEFAQFVARYKPDTKVAIGRMNDQDVAFFPFHLASSGYARGIGAPFCDYQAIVSDPDIPVNGLEFLTKAGIASFAFTSLMDPHNLFETQAMESIKGYRIFCAPTLEERLKVVRESSPKQAKNLRRLGRKIEAEIGPLRLVGDDTNQTSFEAILALKSAQYEKNGMTDVLRPTWVKAFMQGLFDLQIGDFRGCLVSLYAGDKLIAGQFGVRQGSWFHPWIASTCPQSLLYSPGIVFLNEAIQNCDKYGVTVIDMAEGHGHYKAQFCRDPVIVRAGIIGSKPKTAPAQGQSPFAIINRRFDQIAALEPSLGGRLRAFGEAIVAAPRRMAARRIHQHEG